MSSTTHRLVWSPFTCLPKAALTPSGLIQLDTQDQEVELIRYGPLELRWQGNISGSELVVDSNNRQPNNNNNNNSYEPMAPRPKDATGPWTGCHASLLLIVTTHRLVFQEQGNVNNNNNNKDDDNHHHHKNSSNNSHRNDGRFLHLSNVHVVAATGGPNLLHPNASHKLVVSTYTYGDLIVALTESKKRKDRDAIEQQILKALSRKQWEMATRMQEQQMQAHSMTRRRVGVDHILTKHKLKHQQAKKVAELALSGDAEQLLEQASALLQVIQKYTKLLSQSKEKEDETSSSTCTSTSTTTKQDKEDAEKLILLLQDMGMTSALTKDHFAKTGHHNKKEEQDARYYEWLARQIVDFLWTRLPAMGGVISLTDVYCLWNRARGTNLISPEDLRHACDLLRESDGPLNHLGIVQQTFDSGVVVLQMNTTSTANNGMGSSSTNNSHNRFQQLVDLCSPCLTALEASHLLKVSPLLALEQLKQAEREGWLCRDTTLETIRFYPNRFDAFAASSSGSSGCRVGN